MTQLVDIHRVSCNKQGWVVPAGENDSRNVLSGEIAGRNLLTTHTLDYRKPEENRGVSSGYQSLDL